MLKRRRGEIGNISRTFTTMIFPVGLDVYQSLHLCPNVQQMSMEKTKEKKCLTPKMLCKDLRDLAGTPTAQHAAGCIYTN
ncbi:hypothetical protein AB205_0204700 [Aquarana catesbeiana]|uniref:Uncharacterized protein n=1 Tax=Aquarana catesbeiana TaxID=8400 RepID=A0A2G9QKH4_AQUCT|nr:hypothetical protein AB205_0204700 [Aquarana catesbeiana]